MGEHQRLPRRTLVVAGAAYLLASIATAAAQTAPVVSENQVDFTGSLPLIASVGAAPVIAAVVRRQPARRPLTSAQLIMIIAVAFVPAAGNRFVLEVLLGVVLIGQLVLGAVVLVMAWRASPSSRALLAGVFVLPQVLTEAVLLEVFRIEGMVDESRLTVFALALLIIGLVASAELPIERTGAPTNGERSLTRPVIVGASLTLAGSAAIADQSEPFDNGVATGAAIAMLLVGFVVIGTFRPNRKSAATAVHIDGGVLVFGSVCLVLFVWVEFASQFFGNGATLLGPNVDLGFDDAETWRRFLNVLVVLAAIPVITLVATSNRRLLSAGALAGAAAGALWVVFVLSDLELGLVEFILFGILTDVGRLIVLGGTVVFVLRRVDDASIEAALIIVLAAFPLLSLLANQLAFELVGVDLLSNNFDDTANLQLFTTTSAIALVWIAAWWALRPDPRQESKPVLVDQSTSP